MEPKTYQQTTLDILGEFLTAAREIGAESAFEKFRRAEGYNPTYQPLPSLAAVPYVCLRLPTGGGKTLIGTRAIELARNFLARDYPFVLWLVPTKEIREQTLRVLRKPKSFYGEFLREKFGGRVNIFDVTDFVGLRLQDLQTSLNICVATFQSFKVEDREGRKVWQGNENLSAIFARIPRQKFFYVDNFGRHESFGNLVSYLRPLMIVDEAHNYSTTLSFDTTKLLRPSAVIELTATPATNSNVLVKVTASELQAEQMIKFPVILGEVSNSPEKTLDLAAQKRAALEELAVVEEDYLRPIVLYQAESRNRDYGVDYVRNYLIEQAKIPEQEIAVATGERRELAGVDLSSPQCRIRHVITVQALKEGWDCPFAAVFCSLTNTHSARDAEQLLGRVLRMPNARRKKSAELNRAYAFVRVATWQEALKRICDDLLSMGFDRQEVNRTLNRPRTLFPRTLNIETSEPPALDGLNLFLHDKIFSDRIADGWRVEFKDLDDAEIDELEDNCDKIFRRSDDRDKLLRAIYRNDAPPLPKKISPAERGEKFSIPQLCLDLGDGVVVAEREDFFPQDFTLTESGDYDLPLTHEEPDVMLYEINLRGERLTNKILVEENLFSGVTNLTEAELVGRLYELVGNTFFTREDFAEYTRRVLRKLMRQKNFSLEELVRQRFILARKLREKITALKNAAYKRGWQTILFDAKDCVHVGNDIAFTFDAKIYPAQKLYTGTTEFGKHYYGDIGYMNSEEVFCAQRIDADPNVATWIRNVESEPLYSFWLPTPGGKFYPDFVVKLKDGTYAAVEYKGEHLKTNDDSQEKNFVGKSWAARSHGLCKFLMAVKRDAHGHDLSAQIKEFFLEV